MSACRTSLRGKAPRHWGARRLKGGRGSKRCRPYYAIAGRDLERDIVPLLTLERLAMMVWLPLAGGLLSGKYERDSANAEGRRVAFDFPPVDKSCAFDCIDAVRPIADAHGMTVAEVAPAQLLHQPVVTTVIIGARRQDQLEGNLRAVTVRLSPEDLAIRDKIRGLPLEYSAWVHAMQGSTRRPEPFVAKVD